MTSECLSSSALKCAGERIKAWRYAKTVGERSIVSADEPAPAIEPLGSNFARGSPVRQSATATRHAAAKAPANATLQDGCDRGVAFVSTHAVRGETTTGRLRSLRLKGVRVERHFHVIHHETRRVTASARAFLGLLEQSARGSRRPASTGS